MKYSVILFLISICTSSCSIFSTEYNVTFSREDIKQFEVFPNLSQKDNYITSRDEETYEYILVFVQQHEGTWDAYVDNKDRSDTVIIGVIEENPIKQVPRENPPMQSPTYVRTTIWAGSNYIGVGYPDPKLEAGEASFFKLITPGEAQDFIHRLNSIK